MTHRIKVTGYLDIEDDEFDPDHPMGLTSEAYDDYCEQFSLDDLTFEVEQ